MLPDAVLAFKFGIAYGGGVGHRGFTHSLLFAFVLPCCAYSRDDDNGFERDSGCAAGCF